MNDREFRFATRAMREGGLMRPFTRMVGASCFALVGLGVIVQVHPAGPTGVLSRSVQAAVLLSAVVFGFCWLRCPWPRYRQTVAFVVWADGAVAVVATTMSTPEARLCTTLYLGLVGGFAVFLTSRRIVVTHCGCCAALISGITGWAVLFDHATLFGLFVYYMPALVWVVVLPLGGLVIVGIGRRSIHTTARSAHYDPLTGLRNRRGMCAAVTAKFRQSSPKIMTIAVCDIDRFKVLNDRQGHAAGDAALLDMARKLRSLAGEDAVTARIGGDELVLVELFSSCDDIAVLLDRLDPLIHGGVGRAGLTASIGVASHRMDDPHFSFDDVLWRADAAMYDAKHAGGATCVVYPPVGASPARESRRAATPRRHAFG